MIIGMIGNFAVPYSTENDRRWSFEQLGHRVVTFQENKTNANHLKLVLPTLDMLVYSHTHGWLIPGLIEVFEAAKKRGLPTVSVHLDRWAWLERVTDIGTEATWFTEHIFMADGSPEAVELYERHNLNWHYLRPGVVERDCKRMEVPTVNGLRLYKYHEIVFAGSKNYHQEYPFRKQLVEFLQDTYGDRFGHYGNDGIKVARGMELNEIYSAATIVVGDSCFGGRPNYVSDRYYEVRGRGGFLLHPRTEGVDNEGVAHYERGDLQSLKYYIDYYLEQHDVREYLRKQGFDHVRKHETYTQRCQEILDVVFA